MAPVLNVLLEILRILRLARDYIKRFPGRRGASLLALLGRKLTAWWRFWRGKLGSSRGRNPTKRPFVGTEASSGGSAVVGGYVVAASYVPPSASHSSLHVRTDGQQQLAPVVYPVSTHPPVIASLSVDHPYGHNLPQSLGARGLVNRSSGNLSAASIQSRASDRFSIITNSRDSIRNTHGQPSRLPRAVSRQFGRGPDPSRSRERLTRPNTRPNTPSTRPHTPPNPPRLEIITNIPSAAHGNGRVSPFVPPSASSAYTHQPLSPPTHEVRRMQSSTSFVVDVQNPSTESLPISPSTTNPPITEEQLALESTTAHSSPDSPVVDQHDEPVPGSPTSSSAATLDYYLPEGRFVQLINSDQIPRYNKDAVIPRVETPYDVKPLTTTFPYSPDPNGFDQDPAVNQQDWDCSPWEPATHPDGGLYFYDEERRLFTDTDMHNPTMREEIEGFYDYLQRLLQNDELSIPSKNYDLVLDIMVTDDDRISWSYYYACHEARCLFWLEIYDASYMISELFGVKSPAHVKHRLESLYWNHWSLFPVVFVGRRLPLDVYDELMGILMHGCVDFITSKSSTLPYDDDTMRRMIQLVQGAKEATGGLAYYAAGITRLLSFFAHWRFLYFHGQRHARLIRDQTVYDKPKRERSLLITCLSPLLFLAPEVHLREMEKLWTDEVIIETVWKNFMTKLLAEWEGVILWVRIQRRIACVVGSSVSRDCNPVDSDVNGQRRVSCYPWRRPIKSQRVKHNECQSKASIGSIVTALLLARHNRTKQKEDPAGASTYLYQNSHPNFGLEPMAIILSLPWALLMWSISNHATRICVSIMSVLVAALIIWCIRTAWETTEGEDVWRDSLTVFRRTRSNLFKRVKDFNPFRPRPRRVPGYVPQDDQITMTDRLGRV
ncbi:hypothetical protein F5888DRAFT_394389 [Russula emetica]|nr:hypothetical protein F5888DRAFT_394389 [Russula emetica]